jgi:hypothetical protein
MPEIAYVLPSIHGWSQEDHDFQTEASKQGDGQGCQEAGNQVGAESHVAHGHELSDTNRQQYEKIGLMTGV